MSRTLMALSLKKVAVACGGKILTPTHKIMVILVFDLAEARNIHPFVSVSGYAHHFQDFHGNYVCSMSNETVVRVHDIRSTV